MGIGQVEEAQHTRPRRRRAVQQLVGAKDEQLHATAEGRVPLSDKGVVDPSNELIAREEASLELLVEILEEKGAAARAVCGLAPPPPAELLVSVRMQAIRTPAVLGRLWPRVSIHGMSGRQAAVGKDGGAEAEAWRSMPRSHT